MNACLDSPRLLSIRNSVTHTLYVQNIYMYRTGCGHWNGPLRSFLWSSQQAWVGSQTDRTIDAKRVKWTTQEHSVVSRKQTQAFVPSFMSFSSHCLTQGCLQLMVLCTGPDFTLYENKTISQVKSLSRVQLFAAPWTVAYQASPSMGFSRQEPPNHDLTFYIAFSLYTVLHLVIQISFPKRVTLLWPLKSSISISLWI